MSPFFRVNGQASKQARQHLCLLCRCASFNHICVTSAADITDDVQHFLKRYCTSRPPYSTLMTTTPCVHTSITYIYCWGCYAANSIITMTKTDTIDAVPSLRSSDSSCCGIILSVRTYATSLVVYRLACLIVMHECLMIDHLMITYPARWLRHIHTYSLELIVYDR
jgi:hypothetical protein